MSREEALGYQVCTPTSGPYLRLSVSFPLLLEDHGRSCCREVHVGASKAECFVGSENTISAGSGFFQESLKAPDSPEGSVKLGLGEGFSPLPPMRTHPPMLHWGTGVVHDRKKPWPLYHVSSLPPPPVTALDGKIFSRNLIFQMQERWVRGCTRMKVIQAPR